MGFSILKYSDSSQVGDNDYKNLHAETFMIVVGVLYPSSSFILKQNNIFTLTFYADNFYVLHY